MIEFIIPVLMLFTGWKIFAYFSILHLVVTPMILYSPFGLAATTQFVGIMQIVTILQLLG
eukprot:CAMPEP_0168345224 /NCGR_PEP_ID=MMETSP0213-20121227/17416_1 /TAXON_ID=151035 /ORGANISM="Euplotes harpa, Strain FSP1.4" /LENGTH=59 /DNA_ID=CAMNT_0008353379 /DNA_START=265 /DNA_END=440 /DNA_ORIENTATION=+